MALWLQTRLPADEFTSVGSGILDYFKLLLVLCGILVLAYLTIRHLIPRIIGINTSASGPIQVLARFPLEPKKTLYAVRAGADVLLIGSSESGLQLLKQLDPADFQRAVEEIDTAKGGQFARVLDNLRGRKIPS